MFLFHHNEEVIKGDIPITKMSLSKRRKVDSESRVFQEKWTEDYLFTEVNTKAVCLLCSQQVSVLKEYNIQRRYETHHKEKYHHLKGQLRKEEID